MYKRYFSLIVAWVLLALPCTVAAQKISPRIAGLENNADYMSLLQKAEQLKSGEDSIVHVIDSARAQFASAAEEQKEALGARILQLEKALFDIRGKEGQTANKIGAIEQDFVMKNLNGATQQQAAQPTTPSTPSADKQVSNLVLNDYFKDNLTEADYKTLLEAQRRESIPAQLLTTYISNYQQLDSLNTRYNSTADRREAEELYDRIAALEKLNRMAEDSLGRVWSYVFDNKAYAYNYLLDKMGQSEPLKKFDENYRKNRQRITTMQDSVQSAVIYGYPINKRLLQEYEQTLAGILGYTAAKDSIARESRNTAALQCTLPKINIQQRNFIPYGNIERNTPSKFSASNPIPELENYRYGTVYRVRLGSFGQKQAISIFKGVSPLYYTKEDDRYTYYAGGFKTQEEAEQAFDQLKEIGFHTPEVVYWHDGTLENAGTPGESNVFYRVEITGQGEQLNDTIRALAADKAEGKEFSRSNEADGTFIYSIGNFSNKQLAESLCEAINQVVEGCATLRTLANE